MSARPPTGGAPQPGGSRPSGPETLDGRRLTVLHVTWRLSRTGGIPAVIRSLLHGLAGSCLVHVATVRPQSADDDLHEFDGLATFHPQDIAGKVGPWTRARLALRLLVLARHIQPDIVHAHSGTALFAVPAALGARSATRLLDVHDAPGNGRHGRFTEWIEGFLCRRLQFVPVVHSSSVAEQVRQRWRVDAERIEHVPLGIDTLRFGQSAVDKDAWRLDNGLPGDSPLVLYVARLVPSKNVDLLLDIAGILGREGEHGDRRPVFAVVAGGPERQRLEQRIEDEGLAESVRLMGPKVGDDLVAAYAAADIFVSTSDYEGFGLAVVEAMSAGLPVVACAAGGVTDLVVDGRTGWLVPRGDADGAAERLGLLLQDRAAATEMGRAGAARAREFFDTAVMARRYQEVYARTAPAARPLVVTVLKTPSFGTYPSSQVPPRELPYRVDNLADHGLALRWTDAHLHPPWTSTPVAAAVRALERRVAPWLQTVLVLPSIVRSDAVLALFESEGNLLAFARRAPVPSLRRPALVIVTCWLADLVQRGDGPSLQRYRRAYRRVDRLIFFSSNQRAIFAEHLGLPDERLRFVHFGVDQERYRPTQWGHDGGYVLAVGRDAGRDWATFLDAMRRCGLPAKVLCRTSLIKDLEIPPNVEILGYSDEAVYRELLGAARVSVVATKVRSYPTGQSVMLESMAMAKATVVTDTPALRDYLRPGETVVTVPPGDPAALAAAVVSAFDDASLRDRLGDAARAAVEREFTASRMWARIGAIVREACGEDPEGAERTVR